MGHTAYFWKCRQFWKTFPMPHHHRWSTKSPNGCWKLNCALFRLRTGIDPWRCILKNISATKRSNNSCSSECDDKTLCVPIMETIGQAVLFLPDKEGSTFELILNFCQRTAVLGEPIKQDQNLSDDALTWLILLIWLFWKVWLIMIILQQVS